MSPTRWLRLFACVLICGLLSMPAAGRDGDDDEKADAKPKAKAKAAKKALANFPVARRQREIAASDYVANIEYLASDELSGRGIGTDGIDKAQQYIAGIFEKAGLKPGGTDDTYYQEFDLKMWRKIGEDTALSFTNDDDESRAWKVREDFVPLQLTSEGKLSGEVVFAGYGIVDKAKEYDDYAGLDVDGKIVLMLRYEPKFLKPDAENPNSHHSQAAFNSKGGKAADRGAEAIIIVNPDSGDGKDELNDFEHAPPGNLGMPMIHMTRKAANRLLKAAGMPKIGALQKKIDDTKKPASAALEGVKIEGEIAVKRGGPVVRNVLGIFPGSGPNKDEYIIIGGHHDHLGLSVPMFRGGEAKIHNGADDNASGTAGVLECAKLIGGGPPTNRSILFMTYTAEESGLLGSQHWCNNPTIDLKQVVAMLNMDMIGRMRKSKLEIGGMRTGKGFEAVCERLAKEYEFEIVDGGGGRGPSDHASFFSKNIPILFMFTGLHRQYHQPDDDTPLINAEGGAKVAQYVTDIAYEIASWKSRPAFYKDTTPETLLNPGDDDSPAAADARPRRSRPRPQADDASADAKTADEAPTAAANAPRLGIRPAAEDDEPDTGVLVGEVLDQTPARGAGIKTGDRIVRIGKSSVKTADDIRAALTKIKPGESVKVVVVRDDERETVDVKFPNQQPAAGKASRDTNDDGDDDDNDNASKPEDRRASRTGGAGHGEDEPDARPNVSVRLGIAPKYGPPDPKANGWAFEYVSEAGPAAKAGMRDTDLIMSIGGHKVKDIQSYMSALSHFKPNDEVTVVVDRHGEKVELKVKLEGAGKKEKN